MSGQWSVISGQQVFWRLIIDHCQHNGLANGKRGLRYRRRCTGGVGAIRRWKTAASMGKSQLGRWGLYRAVEERLFQSRVKAYITICPSGPVELNLASTSPRAYRGHEMAALP